MNKNSAKVKGFKTRKELSKVQKTTKESITWDMDMLRSKNQEELDRIRNIYFDKIDSLPKDCDRDYKTKVLKDALKNEQACLTRRHASSEAAIIKHSWNQSRSKFPVSRAITKAKIKLGGAAASSGVIKPSAKKVATGLDRQAFEGTGASSSRKQLSPKPGPAPPGGGNLDLEKINFSTPNLQDLCFSSPSTPGSLSLMTETVTQASSTVAKAKVTIGGDGRGQIKIESQVKFCFRAKKSRKQ